MDFVSIDFETATSSPNSICSMGICSVKDDRVIDTTEILIRPDPFEFKDYNILIHGITPDMVRDKPKFCDIWEKIHPVIENTVVVAHNAVFDVGALRATLDHFELEYPTFDYICTVKLSQKAYPDLPSHKLNALADSLELSFNHHHAGDDAYMCAEVLLRIMRDFELDSLEDIEKKFDIGVGKLFPGCYVPCTKSKKSKSHREVYTAQKS